MEKPERPTKDRLKKKLNKKNGITEPEGTDNIFEMLNKVSEILKKDPAMIQKVNKCVSQLIDNKDLMSSLTKEIQTNMNISEPERPERPKKEPGTQILLNNSDSDSDEADSKDSKQ